MVIKNVAEAKTALSALLDAAIAGEEVIIARAGTPLVRLVPVTPAPERTLGFVPITVPDQFFDALDEQELAPWR